MPAAFYRGGKSLKPKPGEVRIDPRTGLLQPTHGVSVYDRPDGLDRFGGAFEVVSLPDTLKVIQRGRDPHHYEIVPAQATPPEEYEQALDQVVMAAV
jgi:hypothetical protein